MYIQPSVITANWCLYHCIKAKFPIAEKPEEIFLIDGIFLYLTILPIFHKYFYLIKIYYGIKLRIIITAYILLYCIAFKIFLGG